MTFKEVLDTLTAAGVPDPSFDARALWRAYSGENTPFVPGAEDFSLSEELALAVERRKKREPLQYILGSVGFYREEYEVSPDCLIPRQDTEILVDLAVKRLPKGARFADLCTGSGCIAVSVLANRTDTSALAVDVSEGALRLAERNARRNGVTDRLILKKSDLMADSSLPLTDGAFHAVLSNPPYVTDSEYTALEPEIYSEPKLAFLGGEDGGDFYRRLLPLADGMLLQGGFIAFEIGAEQGGLLAELAEEHGYECEIVKDYSNLDRVAVLTRKE